MTELRNRGGANPDGDDQVAARADTSEADKKAARGKRTGRFVSTKVGRGLLGLLQKIKGGFRRLGHAIADSARGRRAGRAAYNKFENGNGRVGQAPGVRDDNAGSVTRTRDGEVVAMGSVGGSHEPSSKASPAGHRFDPMKQG